MLMYLDWFCCWICNVTVILMVFVYNKNGIVCWYCIFKLMLIVLIQLTETESSNGEQWHFYVHSFLRIQPYDIDWMIQFQHLIIKFTLKVISNLIFNTVPLCYYPPFIRSDDFCVCVCEKCQKTKLLGLKT